MQLAPRRPRVGVRHERRIVNVVRELGLEGEELVGVDRRSRVSQATLNIHCDWMRAAEHAPRDPCRILERINSLVEIVDCGGGVPVERRRVSRPHPERELITLSRRPETDGLRRAAMSVLGNGLYGAQQYEDALSVQEARLSAMTRLGASLENRLKVQSNIANTYKHLGRIDEAIGVLRDVYSGYSRHLGEENGHALKAATNYAIALVEIQRFKEAKPLMRKTIPVVRRVLGENNEVTLRMRWTYAKALYKDTGATLDDLREAVETLVDVEPIVRRVLGGAHPHVSILENHLRDARAALRACETQPSSDSRDGDLDEVEDVL